jgi:hypothetical protein
MRWDIAPQLIRRSSFCDLVLSSTHRHGDDRCDHRGDVRSCSTVHCQASRPQLAPICPLRCCSVLHRRKFDDRRIQECGDGRRRWIYLDRYSYNGALTIGVVLYTLGNTATYSVLPSSSQTSHHCSGEVLFKPCTLYRTCGGPSSLVTSLQVLGLFRKTGGDGEWVNPQMKLTSVRNVLYHVTFVCPPGRRDSVLGTITNGCVSFMSFASQDPLK